jgi:hypothetical protein
MRTSRPIGTSPRCRDQHGFMIIQTLKPPWGSGMARMTASDVGLK